MGCKCRLIWEGEVVPWLQRNGVEAGWTVDILFYFTTTKAQQVQITDKV